MAGAAQPARVLVVDEDVRLLEGLERRLTHLGLHTLVAQNTAAAAPMAASGPDAAFLDLAHKDIARQALIRVLSSRGIPVVVMSGSASRQDLIDCIRIGARDFLEKPFSHTALNAALERALGAGQLYQAAAPGANEGSVEEAERPPEPERVPISEWVVDDRLIDDLLDGRLPLPTPAPIVDQLRALQSQPTCGVDEVLRIVSEDAALIPAVLRAATRTDFQGRRAPSNLRAACVRLGNQRVLGLAQEAVMEGLFVGAGPYGELLSRLWTYVRLVAWGARQLAVMNGGIDPEEAHMAGLLHDLGLLLGLNAAAHRCLPPRGDDDVRLLTSKLDSIHEPLGRLLLDRWGVPSSISRLAGTHHSAPAGPVRRGALTVRDVVAISASQLLARGSVGLPGIAPPFLDPTVELAFSPDTLEQLFSSPVFSQTSLEP